MKFNFFSSLPKCIEQRHIDTDDGHQIFYARYGNPNGKLVVSLHGGPGGSGRIKKGSFDGYDFNKYQILFINQRGCGLSLPSGKIEGNDTNNLLNDIKRIIEETGVKDKIILRGVSWGSTLALLFAQKHPQMIEKLILTQVFLAREKDIDWTYNQSYLFYPDILDKIKTPIKKGVDLTDYYHDIMFNGSIVEIKKAMESYGAWEIMIGSLEPKFPKFDEISEREIASLRIYTHFEKNKFFIKDNQILEDMYKIRNIPTLIVHNRLDFVCPLSGAYDLSKEFENVKLAIVAEKGHVGDLLYKTIPEEIKEFLS